MKQQLVVVGNGMAGARAPSFPNASPFRFRNRCSALALWVGSAKAT